MANRSDANVYVVAVENSDFDACQSIVKTCSRIGTSTPSTRVGAINSINWGAKSRPDVYYFSAYFQLTEGKRRHCAVRRRWNFGDILAGWYAKQLGLPMGPLTVATNENDILERFFRTGRYEAEEARRQALRRGRRRQRLERRPAGYAGHSASRRRTRPPWTFYLVQL